MQEQWKIAAVGGLAGAVLAVVLVVGAVALHLVPVATDARLQSYLLGHPKLVLQMQTLAEAQVAEETRHEQEAIVKRIGIPAFFDPRVAFVTGPASARNTVIEFYDYNCGHCRTNAAVVKAFLEKHHSDVRFAFIEFPIFGENSINAAQTAVAAHRQGDRFLAFHFELMTKGAADSGAVLAAAQSAGLNMTQLIADMRNPETEKSLLAGYRLARELKFGGTPMFIINGQIHEGEITEDDLRRMMR